MGSFQHIDVINGFCLDYMHCVLLGIVKNLIKLWCSSSNFKMNFYLNKNRQTTLNARLLAVKPISEISRKPRALDQLADLKANEFRSLLLFYLPICLEDLLPKKYIDHLRLLSFSIYILLKPKISSNELELCERRISEFVPLYQKYYGKINMTMNIHLLLHMVECVKNCGPLWSQSAFAFESFNGRLLKFVNGHLDVLCQITSKYILSVSHTKSEGCIDCEATLLGRSVNLKIDDIEHFHVFKRIRVGLVIYTSMFYTKAEKSIDYFLCFNNGVIGAVRYYYKREEEIFISYEKYTKIGGQDQFIEISPSGIIETAPTKNIAQKLIFIPLYLRMFVVSRPNNYEKD